MTTESSHPRDFVVNVGDEVFSRDGERLGRVKELAAEHFKVDAPRASDYWLARATISSPPDGGAGRLCLTFNKEQIEDFKLEGPFAHSESPVLDATADTFVSADDVDRRRKEWTGDAKP
jgi:hypothetical protein